jgi:hypothetical protein
LHLQKLEEDGHRIGEFLEQKIIAVIARLGQIRDKLQPEKQRLLEVRVFSDHHLYCSMLQVDEKYFVTSYLHTVGSKSAPFVILEGLSSPWAITYGREFNTIWASAINVFP